MMHFGKYNSSGGFINNMRGQRTIALGIVRWILVITTLFLSTVSCKTVTISSGFEKKTLQEGDNFTLQCSATGLYHVTITWLLDGLPLEYIAPEPSGSIRLEADNPHLNPNFLKSRDSRYMIKNSNENTDSEEEGTSDVISDDIKDRKPGGDVKEVSNSTEAILDKDKIATTPPIPVVLPPSNQAFKEPAALVPANIDLTDDSMVSVTSVLTLNNATVKDGGIYACIARDIVRDSARWSRKIAVAGPLSLRQNRPIFALIDSVVVIPCTVLGTGDNLPVKWSYKKFSDDGVYSTGSAWTALPNDRRQTVHTNGSLEIREARKANEGVYMCQVELNGKQTNMSTPLKVMVPPKIKPLELPQVQVGETVAEFCVVSEGDTPLDITWYKDGVLLRPNKFMVMHRSGKRALSLTISSVDLTSAGNYSCCATNNVSRTCHKSQLVVLDPPDIPDLRSEVSAISGNNLQIPCKATGFPKPNVTWMRVVVGASHDYVKIPQIRSDKDSKTPSVSQMINGSLFIRNISSAHAGKYMCRAVNKVDELSRFVTIQVHNPARIVELRATSDVIYRNDVIIECQTWGDDEVNVVWFKDGKPLRMYNRHNATIIPHYRYIETRHFVTMNRLIIKDSMRSDNGSYSCHASNSYGPAKKSIDVIVRSPPFKPSNFEVIDKGTSFLRMIVSPGKDDGGSRILEYELNYTKIVEETSPQPANGRQLPSSFESEDPRTVSKTYHVSPTSRDQEILLDELECGTEYNMNIRAINQIGISFEAQEITGRTMGTDPVIPVVNELVVHVNQTAVVLDLRAWQNGGCPITDLTVEFARHGDTDWNVTSIDTDILQKELSETENGEKSGTNPGHLVISNLEPGTWYKIWSSACNNAGCNYVTHSISTLLPNGATVPPLKNEVEKKVADSADVRFLVPMVCGFGLVLLLVLLLLFYRYKQRSKKQMRLKAARKMANKLLYTTDDNSAPPAGIRVELPDQSPQDDSDNAGTALVDTSISNASDDEHQQAHDHEQGDTNTITARYFDEVRTEHSDTLCDLPTEQNSHSISSSSVQKNNSVNSHDSENSKKSDGKVSLKDNAELAVFRDAISSDDEDETREPLVCDESAFGDSGTWSYFQPGSQARRPRKHHPPPAVVKKPVPRRLSSSSSGTDEELAQVFGLPCSKQNKFKPLDENRRVLKSDLNENYRPASLGKHRGKNHPRHPEIIKQTEPKPSLRKNEHFFNVVDQQERANSTGMVPKTNNARLFKPLPGDVAHQNRRPNYPPQHRSAGISPNTNPFKTAFRPPQQQPFNFHRPNKGNHTRGHTYSHETPQHKFNFNNSPFLNAPQFGTNVLNASPYGERQWVDTYDSQYGTTRSKPPSWGSTELDKQGFYTPPVSVNQQHPRDVSPKYHTPEIPPEHSSFPCKESTRKLETNSPRDSGIGSDEGPVARHSTSSISPPHLKGRNVQKSLESLDEVECRKGSDRSSTKDSVFPPSPPPSPHASETKLTPHIFVDISSKCNTTPTRSSYPPCRQVPAANYGQLGPKKLDYLPTPPLSGPTSPEDLPRSRKTRGNDGWSEADLDGLTKYHHKSDSRLADEENYDTKQRNSDTTYTISKDDRTWQASTLV